ncbi:MAG: serine/threonine-protein phosphatase [Bacteroidetes bacterium]|nr:MAG: serine/threonine-protein phosphatase [Bacteroidota bacterium]
MRANLQLNDNSLNTRHYILSHPGKRKLNEDNVYPQHVDAEGARTFLVCDGVGGSNRGEVASDIVSRSIGTHLSYASEVNPQTICDAIRSAEQSLNAHSELYPECKGMASTVVGFHPNSENSAFVYWVGDSRLYHIRKGEVLFRTRDHSLVQLMVDQGHLTEEEARKSNRKNIILQAISDGNRFATPDITELTDIESGDILLLLSDGILEGCPESELIEQLSKCELKSAFKEIRVKCEEKSRDNFSLIALEVE